jgi:hypothetical protein
MSNFLGLGPGVRIPDARPVQDRLYCPRVGPRRKCGSRKSLNEETKSQEENYFRLINQIVALFLLSRRYEISARVNNWWF